MKNNEKEIKAMLLDSVGLNRAEFGEGPDNLWAITLKSGSDERSYLLHADHLRLLAEK